MAKIDEKQQRSPRSSWLAAAGAIITWDLAKKVSLSAIGLFVLGVIVLGVWRECRFDGIVVESMVVKGSAGDGAPNAEMASQQIATYIDKIQRTGVREWRPHDLDDGEQRSVSIQIPGSSLNVESVVREVASLFPHRRRSLRISITTNPFSAGYVGAVAISDSSSTTRATCEADGRPGALGAMFECLAVESMKVIDPLFAASYVLSLERKHCAKFEPDRLLPSINKVANEIRQLEALREHCGFERTRAIVAAIIERGVENDQVWVPYIYSKLHLARAKAVSKIDPEAQFFEFDRAINRFEALSRGKVPPTALAAQMWAYLRNGLSIQESVLALDWKDNSPLIKQRLEEADKFLKDAARRLRELADNGQNAPTPAAPKARPADQDPLRPMLSHLEGVILYRQWMIEAHKRKPENPSNFAEGAEEKKQLDEAVKSFQTSQSEGKQGAQFFLQWGNALLALRRFDDAVKRYRHAGDMAPTNNAPMLNVAVALLEKSMGSAATLKDRFEAVRQTSSYLTWASDGGPFDILPIRIAKALNGMGDGREATAFDDCRRELAIYEADPKVRDMTHTAALKICVDRARDSLSGQIAKEAVRLQAPLLQ